MQYNPTVVWEFSLHILFLLHKLGFSGTKFEKPQLNHTHPIHRRSRNTNGCDLAWHIWLPSEEEAGNVSKIFNISGCTHHRVGTYSAYFRKLCLACWYMSNTAQAWHVYSEVSHGIVNGVYSHASVGRIAATVCGGSCYYGTTQTAKSSGTALSLQGEVGMQWYIWVLSSLYSLPFLILVNNSNGPSRQWCMFFSSF